jgi:hypothetical protein
LRSNAPWLLPLPRTHLFYTTPVSKMSSRLPPLPTQTHDFAYHATRALSTVNLVPSSPAPRSDESVKEEDNTPRLLTPPLPVKSPRRNVDSPEPPPKRRNVDSPDPPPKRTQAKYATGPLPAPAPPAKPARQPHLQVPTQQTYVSDNCQRLGEQQVALQPLPTSYYAPVFCPSGTVPKMREKQKKKVEKKDKKKLRNRQPKAAWHKLRLALRAFVVALLLFGLSMSLWLWPGDFMATSVRLCSAALHHIHRTAIPSPSSSPTKTTAAKHHSLTHSGDPSHNLQLHRSPRLRTLQPGHESADPPVGRSHSRNDTGDVRRTGGMSPEMHSGD